MAHSRRGYWFFSANGAAEFPAVADGGNSKRPKERSSQICVLLWEMGRDCGEIQVIAE